ncbi:unnamed protein product, partial [Closterium sp. NIES-53]
MAAQELRWLTYLLTDLGEQPRSPPVLYVDNKATIALCGEYRLEHRTKHIALRYFLARELQQRGQLCLRYVATRANTADVFTKALQPCDHQRFCTVLGLAVDDILPSSPPSLSPSNPFNWRIFVHSRIEVRRVARHFPPDTRHGSKDDEPPCRPSSHHGRGASLAAARLVAHITCTPRIRRSNLTCDSESSRPTASAIVAVRHQHVHRVRGVVGPPGLQGGEQRAARGTACRAVGAGGGARGGVRPAELEPGAGVDQAARA